MRFEVGNLPFVVTDVDKEGRISLSSAVAGHTLHLWPSQLFEGMHKGEIRPWGRPYFARKRLPFFDYDELDEEQRERIQRKTRYVMALHRLGNVSFRRSNGIFQKVIDATAVALGDPNPPAATTAYDLLRDFRACGCDPKVFARQLGLKRPRGTRNQVLQDLIDAVVLELYQQSKTPPTNAEIQKLVNKRYAQLQKSEARVVSRNKPDVSAKRPKHD
ncbi:hypothetical protein [Variovorax sp. JS1663]|uniref:hypothetical protein n=1 Tax=Variovorax sp. JS1663 TaxID=1851577 RepID=UPI000B349A0F|nr:hypothetical protein [Variovorax sp. JS1663]OUM02976.1 hypothetical protein A8M77_08525 [Variovorax sp. JS1663]